MKFRQILIFLLGLSIPFNNLGISVAGRSTSIGLFVTAMYFISMFQYVKKIHSLQKYYGRVIWNILLYIILFTFINMVNWVGYNTPIFPFSLFMCYFMFLLLLKHGLVDRKSLPICLYGIAFGGVLMSILYHFGIGVTIDIDERLVMFGENSNMLGIYMGLSSIIILTDFILRDDLKLAQHRFWFILCFIPIVNLLFATGSRTAFLIFAVSVLTIIIFYPTRSKFGKLLFMATGMAVSMYAFLQLEKSNSVLFQRLLNTIEEGNVSGRDHIASALIPFIEKSPIWGYGQTGYVDVAQQALQKISIIGGVTYGYSPHNVILEILLYCGFMGLLFWLFFWIRIFKQSYYLLIKRKLIMSTLLLVPIIACIFSGQLLTAKWAYVLFAYIMSEYYYSQKDIVVK